VLEPEKQSNKTEERPPFFPSWNMFYFFTLLWLMLIISLLYEFTKMFS